MISKNFGLSNCNGFTLIEMMIVAVIISTVASLAAPSFQRAYDRQDFKTGQQEVISTLKKARSYAISTKEAHGVYIDPETLTITLFENSSNPSSSAFDDGDETISVDTVSGSYSYIYADMENSAIVFQPNGSAQITGQGSIYLSGETEDMMAYVSINVMGSTGRIDAYAHYYAW
jgi:prepilin-type N-terminal cleavage/methylation domain-containing protein